jgi:hypothetical protein
MHPADLISWTRSEPLTASALHRTKEYVHFRSAVPLKRVSIGREGAEWLYFECGDLASHVRGRVASRAAQLTPSRRRPARRRCW